MCLIDVTRTDWLVLKIEPQEFLHTLTGVHFGREDISLPVDSDIVESRELADLTGASAWKIGTTT